MFRLDRQNIAADGFRLFSLVQRPVVRNFTERLINAALRNGFELVLHTASTLASYSDASFRSEDLTHDLQHWIIELVHDALFERDDGVIGDLDLFRTHFRTAFRDV